MVSSKAGVTHQAVNRYDQLARTRESRRGAEGYEPTENDDLYRWKIVICAGRVQGKNADACSRPHI
jgi:hypothetical protein